MDGLMGVVVHGAEVSLCRDDTLRYGSPSGQDGHRARVLPERCSVARRTRACGLSRRGSARLGRWPVAQRGCALPCESLVPIARLRKAELANETGLLFYGGRS